MRDAASNNRSADSGQPADNGRADSDETTHVPSADGGLRASATDARDHTRDASLATATDTSGGHAIPDGGADNVSCARCQTYATPLQTGQVAASELDALSGLTASRSQPDIIFAHNDHERAVVYALDLQGRLHARVSLPGALATDLEDIALGPCGTEECLYLGDIGDNAAQREEYAILRFVEPKVPSTPGSTALTATVERYRFKYEDGSHNAESLMVAPDGALYIVTKLASGSGGRVPATGPSSIYRLVGLSTEAVARATKLATLSVPTNGDLAASAAAAHPCGRGFLLRTYDKIYEFVAPAGADFEAAFLAQPSVITMPSEAQSEGIDYRPDGLGFISSGEGSRAPIFAASCAK